MLQLKLRKGGLDNDTLVNFLLLESKVSAPTSAAALRVLNIQRPALSDTAYLSPDLPSPTWREREKPTSHLSDRSTELAKRASSSLPRPLHTNSGRLTLFQTVRFWNYAYHRCPIIHPESSIQIFKRRNPTYQGLFPRQDTLDWPSGVLMRTGN
jgi:hypothetical protein